MAIPTMTNNSPNPGYIAWGSFTIQLYGVAYSVSAGSTNQRWVWWEYNNGTPVINAGADVPQTLTDDDLVLFANKNGIGVRVQSTSFVDGELLVDGSIFADALSTNLINSQHIVTAGLDAGVIKFGVMNGDRIAVNTLQGDRILANSIVASKLAITDWENYVPDPYFDLQRWNLQAGVTYETVADLPLSIGAGTVLRFDGGGTRESWTADLFSTKPSETHRISCFVRKITAAASPTGTALVRLRFYDQAGVNSTPFYLQAGMNTSAMVQNQWYELVIDNAQVPAGRTDSRLDMLIASTNVADDFEFALPQVNKKNNGRLIVDGTITTDQLGAESVTTTKLGAGSVVADKIAAQSIAVSKLIVSDLTNYIADGDLFDPTSANWQGTGFARTDPAGDVAYASWPTTAAGNAHIYNINLFEVEIGDEFSFEAEVSTPATNTVPVKINNAIHTVDGDGLNPAFPTMPVETLAPNTDWTKIEGVIKITSATAARGRYSAYISATPATAGQIMRIRKVSLRKRHAGKLIIDGTIETEQLASESVTANNISSEAVTADKIIGELIWTSEQWVGQIHIHPTQGITIPQTGSDEVTHLAADGSGSSFAGAIVANDGLTSYGGVNMQGTDNFLAGELVAGTGVNDPSTPPTVSSSYDTVSTGEDGGFYRKGLTEFHDGLGSVWVTTDTIPNGDSNIQAWSKTGGAGFWATSILSGWQAYGGVTRIGGYYYVLCRQKSTPTNWRILIYRGSDSAYVSSFDTNPTNGQSISTTAFPAIGTDGVSIIIAWAQNSILNVRKINPWAVTGAGQQTGATVGCGAWSASTHVIDVQGVGGKWFIASNAAIYAFTTAGARDAASDFPKNTGALSGMSHDGATWTTYTSGKIFTKHTTLSGRYIFAYDFRDADTAGSGTANTRPSPVKDITPVKFAKWTVTIPQAPPDDLTTDGANTCRIFAAPYGSPLVFQYQLVTDGNGLTGKPLSYSRTFTTIATSGAAPNVVNDFSSRATSAIGRYSSSKKDGSEPMWRMDGDGSWKLGKFLRGNADGTDANDTGWVNITKAAAMSAGTLRYRVKSGILTVHVDGTASVASGAVTRLDAAALPVALRPSVQVRGAGYAGGFAATLVVDIAGTISIVNNTGAARTSASGAVYYPIE